MLVKFSLVSTTPEQGVEGRGIQAYLLCLLSSYVGRKGHGHQIYQHTWTIGFCATHAMHPSHCPAASGLYTPSH